MALYAMFNRKTIRLPDYNYSTPGEYFITICVKHRLPVLGQVINGEMHLSTEGEIVRKWINDVIAKFSDVIIEHYIIMPDHIHLIIELQESGQAEIAPISLNTKSLDFEKWRIQRKNMLLPKIISYLKANSAREINKLHNKSEVSFWQANYYEHIIRDENAYHTIARYIKNNPANWKDGTNPVRTIPGLSPDK